VEMFRLDYLSCLLTVVATILVGRKKWAGLVVSGVNSLIVCVIGVHTAQYGFIPGNVFCICINAFNLKFWLSKGKHPACLPRATSATSGPAHAPPSPVVRCAPIAGSAHALSATADISLATPPTVHRAQPAKYANEHRARIPWAPTIVFTPVSAEAPPPPPPIVCRSVFSVQSSTHAEITEQPLDRTKNSSAIYEIGSGDIPERMRIDLVRIDPGVSLFDTRL